MNITGEISYRSGVALLAGFLPGQDYTDLISSSISADHL